MLQVAVVLVHSENLRDITQPQNPIFIEVRYANELLEDHKCTLELIERLFAITATFTEYLPPSHDLECLFMVPV